MAELWTFTLSLHGHLPQVHLPECSRGASLVPEVPATETLLTHVEQPRPQKGEAVWWAPGGFFIVAAISTPRCCRMSLVA